MARSSRKTLILPVTGGETDKPHKRTEHQLDRLKKMLKEARPTPIVEYQWERVRQWRERLQVSTPPPALVPLETSWQAIDPALYAERGFTRSSDEGISGSVFDALFVLIGMGVYPPPELLLTLRDCYLEYIRGAGELSLEDAFFGPPKHKGGNFARRQARDERNAHLAAEFFLLQRDGFSSADAAAVVSRKSLKSGRKLKPGSVEKILTKWLKMFRQDPRFEEYAARQECAPVVKITRLKTEQPSATEEVDVDARTVFARDYNVRLTSQKEFLKEMFDWLKSEKRNGVLPTPGNEDIPRVAQNRGFVSQVDGIWKLTEGGRMALDKKSKNKALKTSGKK